MEPIVAPSAADGSRVADVPLMAKRFQGASSFVVGFDVTEKEAEEARRKRAQRFGRELETSAAAATPGAPASAEQEMESDADGLSLPRGAAFDRSVFPDALPEGDGCERTDALYVFGVDDMSTSDVMKVFQTYSPNHLEWVNDQSCVVVWQDVFSAKRALFALGRWELGRPAVATRGEESSSEGTDDDDDRRSARNLIVAPKCEPSDWRVTTPVHHSQHLLLRFASEGDRKKRGAGQKSSYYRRHGNPHTGQGGEVSLADLRARRSKKRPHDESERGNGGDVTQQPDTDTAMTTDVLVQPGGVKEEQDGEAAMEQESAHLLIRVSNTVDDADTLSVAVAADSDSGHEASPAGPPSCGGGSLDNLQTLTIKVEVDSDDELERHRRASDGDAVASAAATAASHSPSPKRRRRERDPAASGAHDKETLEKMCITFSVDRDDDDAAIADDDSGDGEDERSEQMQRDQNRLLDEQRQAILERRRLRERLGHKPGNLSSVVVRPGAVSRAPSAAHASSRHRHRHDDSVKREEEDGGADDNGDYGDRRHHRASDGGPPTDLRNRLKERRRDHGASSSSSSGVLASSSGRFKPPVAGSLTITCDFENR